MLAWIHSRGIYGLNSKSMTTNRFLACKIQTLLAGDVNLNPGPVKDPCGSCHDPVKNIGI